MVAVPNISYVAMLIADPSRAAILTALLDGQSLPASELARCAQISPQTASSHLSKLLEGNLITVIQQGRHRYYRLASGEIAQVLESMATLAPSMPVRSFNQSQQAQSLRLARTCYDHLAGELGVKITQALLEKGILECGESDYRITELGWQWLADFGIDRAAVQNSRRTVARQCLDWSERYYHLAGALGTAIAHRLFELRWIVKLPNSRSVRVTATGQMQLKKCLGLEVSAKT